jgi:autotransporter-associated beta strand protein
VILWFPKQPSNLIKITHSPLLAPIFVWSAITLGWAVIATHSAAAPNEEGNSGQNTASATPFSFNDTIFKITANNNDLFPEGAIIKASGAQIDTNGFNARINLSIVHDGSLGSALDGGLTKLGAGSLSLGGENTFTGKTLVSEGTLLVNNVHGSGLGKSTVTVRSGATLAGVGSFSGSVKIEKGGILAPGDSLQGLTGGGLVLDDGAVFSVDLDSSAIEGTEADIFIATDIVLSLSNPPYGLTVGKGVELKVADLARSPMPFPAGRVLSIINYTGDWSRGVFTLNGKPLNEGEIFTAGLTQWKINYTSYTGGGNFSDKHRAGSFVNITAQPGAVKGDSMGSTIYMVAGGISILVASILLFLKRRSKIAPNYRQEEEV